MLRYLLIFVHILSGCESQNITINHDKGFLLIDGISYKSSLIESNTEYTIHNNELILSNQYYARNQSVEYFIFDRHSLFLKKYLEISCDNLTKVCAGSMTNISTYIHIKDTLNEDFLDKVGDCNIEFISTYPDDTMDFEKIDTDRKVSYKINNKVYNFIYDSSYPPNRMYLTKNHALFIPLCETKNHKTSILECKIIDEDYRTYDNIHCKEMKK